MKQKLLKKNFLSSLKKSITLILAGMFLFHTVNATTWYVNDGSTTGDAYTTAIGNDANAGTAAAPFATIQFAINAAATGDTIQVDAGTYTSGDINITKSLTLRGAKFGVSAGPEDAPVGRGTNETIVQGSFYYGQSLDNITVDGFTMDVGTALRGIQARGLNSVIINNILTGTITPAVQQQGIATRANAPNRLHSYIISHNNVRGFRFGIYMDGNTENSSEISYNYVTACLETGLVFTASNGHHIKANVSENNGQGMNFSHGNNLIEDNTVTGNAVIGIRLSATSQTFGNNILNNYITNNGVGIGLTQDDAGSVNNQANFNSITGNVLNIQSTHTANFNAQCNWYGSTIAALIALQINGNVNFNPFLANGVDTDPADGFQPNTTCIVQPVILTAFTAGIKNYDVLLNWQTASEINSSHFIIERSLDNQTFTGIGRVAAKGFSDVKANYNFTDNKPVNFDRPTYYRLAMYDLDGTRKYSKIISIILKTNGSYVEQVYPNPVKAGTAIHADFISALPQTITISFISSTGQVLQQTKEQAFKGINNFNINVPVNAARGVNFLLIRSDDFTKQIPVNIH